MRRFLIIIIILCYICHKNPRAPTGQPLLKRLLPAGDQLAAGRRADGLDVVVLQRHALRRQLVQGGGLEGGVVVADVVEALCPK